LSPGNIKVVSFGVCSTPNMEKVAIVLLWDAWLSFLFRVQSFPPSYGTRVSQAGGHVTRIYPDYHLLVEVSSLPVPGGYQAATRVY
jgi:hypothetical protein